MLVKKDLGKRRICVDYTDLNYDFPKYSSSFSNIDKLVDSSSSCKLLSFMDASFRYNQILMYEADRNKTIFMIEGSNYQYNIMLFGLKNLDAAY